MLLILPAGQPAVSGGNSGGKGSAKSADLLTGGPGKKLPILPDGQRAE